MSLRRWTLRVPEVGFWPILELKSIQSGSKIVYGVLRDSVDHVRPLSSARVPLI